MEIGQKAGIIWDMRILIVVTFLLLLIYLPATPAAAKGGARVQPKHFTASHLPGLGHLPWLSKRLPRLSKRLPRLSKRLPRLSKRLPRLSKRLPRLRKR